MPSRGKTTPFQHRSPASSQVIDDVEEVIDHLEETPDKPGCMPVSIQFSCPICKKALQVRDDQSGATVRCPGCENVLQVPFPEWFYTVDGKTKYGPVSSAQLKGLANSAHLQPTDLVWKEGMAQWVPAGKLKGLFSSSAVDAVAAVPKPYEPLPDGPLRCPSSPTQATTTSQTSQRGKDKTEASQKSQPVI